MPKPPARRPSILATLRRARQVEHDGQPHYAVVDILAALDVTNPTDYWASLKKREPHLATLCDRHEFPGRRGAGESLDAADFAGVLRIVEAVSTPKAEKLKTWLAQSAADHLAELDNPEAAILRIRQEYERRGYSRQWIDQRLRGVSARQELAEEWHRRGATDSEHYRALTNDLMAAAFGMDVEALRRFKQLPEDAGANLRDHMTDLELALTALAEITATTLHRAHQPQDLARLTADVRDAGTIAAHTREQIEQATGQPVLTPASPVADASPASRAGRQARDHAAEPEPSPTPRPQPADRPA